MYIFSFFSGMKIPSVKVFSSFIKTVALYGALGNKQMDVTAVLER